MTLAIPDNVVMMWWSMTTGHNNSGKKLSIVHNLSSFFLQLLLSLQFPQMLLVVESWVFRLRNEFISVVGIISPSQSLCQSHLGKQTLKSIENLFLRVLACHPQKSRNFWNSSKVISEEQIELLDIFAKSTHEQEGGRCVWPSTLECCSKSTSARRQQWL